MAFRKIDDSKIEAIADAVRDIYDIDQTEKDNYRFSVLTIPAALSNFKSPSKQWCIANMDNTSTFKVPQLSHNTWMIKGCIHVDANDSFYVVYPDGSSSDEVILDEAGDYNIVIKGGAKVDYNVSNKIKVVFPKANSTSYVKHSFVPTRLIQHVDYYDKSPYPESSVLLFSEDVEYGGRCTYTGEPTPEDNDLQTYKFDGWVDYPTSSTEKINMDFVSKDMSLAPNILVSARLYTVKFYNGPQLLYTDHVTYGSGATYRGEQDIETMADGQGRKGYIFDRWDKQFSRIYNDTNVYAVFVETLVSEKITDSWTTLINRVNNGTYKQYYCVGNYIDLPVSGVGTFSVQIVGVDADYINTTSKSTRALTFLSHQASDCINWGNSYTSIGYKNSNLRNHLINEFRPKLPSTVRNAIKTTCKPYIQYETNWQSLSNPPIRFVYDDIWAPGIFDGDGGTHGNDAPAGWVDPFYIQGSLENWKSNRNTFEFCDTMSFIGMWYRDQWYNYYNGSSMTQCCCDYGYFRPNESGGAIFGFCI